MEKDRLLNKYRSRYQSLSSQVSRTKLGSKSKVAEMHEYYKKEGAIMKNKYEKGKISVEKFEKWIDSTKIKTRK